MRNHRFPITIIIVALALFLSACRSESQVHPSAPSSVMALFASVPIDIQIAKADIIFAGTITDISKTRWNQDSGEWWEERDKTGKLHIAQPYYTIEIVVDRPILNAQQGQNLAVTVADGSPVDVNQVGNREPETGLAVGDQVVMFAGYGEIGWRGGRRPALMVLSAPENSCFVLGEDGLYRTAQRDEQRQPEEPVTWDKLAERIAKVRTDAGG